MKTWKSSPVMTITSTSRSPAWPSPLTVAAVFAFSALAFSPSRASADSPRPADAAASTKADPDAQPAKEEKPKDKIRFRGGFDIGGGFATFSGVNGGLVTPISFRLGVQFNAYFGLVYSNTPVVTLLAGDSGVAAGVLDENAILAILTLGNFFDLGAGPSLDVYALGSIGPHGVAADSGIAPGVATRVAFNIGSGPSKETGRRSAFNISVAPHFTIDTSSGTPLIAIPVGIGAEWF